MLAPLRKAESTWRCPICRRSWKFTWATVQERSRHKPPRMETFPGCVLEDLTSQIFVIFLELLLLNRFNRYFFWVVSRSGICVDFRFSLRCRWSSLGLLQPQDTDLAERFLLCRCKSRKSWLPPWCWKRTALCACQERACSLYSSHRGPRATGQNFGDQQHQMRKDQSRRQETR